jgi:threonine aldolase
VARAHDLKMHMDGARFANALVYLGCTPAEMTWKAGIDVLSFGGTKNGAMILEAVVFFDLKLADDFLYRRKRAGQLLSKGRFLSAQMLSYLKDGGLKTRVVPMCWQPKWRQYLNLRQAFAWLHR